MSHFTKREIALSEMAEQNRWSPPTVNKTSPEELRRLSNLVSVCTPDLPALIREDVESRVRMANNSLMCGDGGPAFLSSHQAALDFIASLLHLRSLEMEYTRQVEDYALQWKDGVHS